MKKALLFLFLFGVSFLFDQKSFAWETYNWTSLGSDTYLCQYFTGYGCDSTSYGSPYQQISPSDSLQVNTIALKSQHYGSIMNRTWLLYIKNTSGTTVATYEATIPSTTAGYPNVTSTQTLVFTPTVAPYTLLANNHYRISYRCNPDECGNPNYPSDQWLAHTPSTTYTNSENYDKTELSTGATTPNKDAWININGFNVDGTNISWYATPTSSCDFSTWPTVINNLGENFFVDYPNASVVVQYGIGPDIMFYNDWTTVSCSMTGCSDNPDNRATNGGVAKTTPLTTGYTYYAKAYIYNDLAGNIEFGDMLDVDKILAESGTWSFILSGQNGENNCKLEKDAYPSFTWPFVTTTPQNPYNIDLCSDIDDSSFTGQVKKAMYMALQTMFKPSDQSITNFTNLKSLLEKKPPFGYFSIYSETLENFENSTSTTSTINNTTLNETFVAVKDISIFDTFYNIVVILLWCGFGFYVVKRFKNFKLE